MPPTFRAFPLLFAATLTGTLGFGSPALATYSIIAIDGESGQLGGAGTSCVGSLSLSTILGFADGAGVVAAQAQINTNGRDRAVQLLTEGRTAGEIITEITAFQFDFIAGNRQYAVLDVDGGAAGFTGNQTMAFAQDRQGRSGRVAYSVQGNILTSVAVLDQAESVFSTPSCDLAETLMRALEEGARNGQGDSRCTPDGIPSDSAHLRVDDGAGNTLIDLGVTDTAPMSPLVLLRARFDAWRAEHPCASPGPADGGLPGPTADLDAGGASEAGTPGARDAGNVLGDAGAVDAASTAPVLDANTPRDGAEPASEERRRDDTGCAVNPARAPAGSHPPRAWLVFSALALVIGARRLRRRARV